METIILPPAILTDLSYESLWNNSITPNHRVGLITLTEKPNWSQMTLKTRVQHPQLLWRVILTLGRVLSKRKWVNFHSFKELNEGQYVFEWKTTLKGVKVVILITIFHFIGSEKFTSTLVLEWNFTTQKRAVLRFTPFTLFSILSTRFTFRE